MLANSIIEAFLVNLLIIIFFILASQFYIYWKKVDEKQSNIMLIVQGSLSVFLCMQFPAEISEGHFFDLRGIPIILLGLYRGYAVMVPVIVITIITRFFIGGGGLLPSLQLIPFYLIFPFFTNVFNKMTTKKRTFFVAISALYYAIIVIFLTSTSLQASIDLRVSLIFIAVEVFGMIFTLSVVEFLKTTQDYRRELIKKEKLNIVSELAASISHEDRNPLTVTRGFLQILNDPTLSQEKREQYITLCLSELDKANAIITDYLTFAKPSPDKIEIINLSIETKKIAEVIIPYANMRIVDVAIDVAAEVYIRGEKQKLHQALLNIMKNGIEAMSDGGTLFISVQQTSDEKVAVIVEDTGVGMDHDQLRKLGEPYFTTKETGTGLGMMAVFNIIEMMKGKIKIKSEKEKGTVISIYFPAVKKKINFDSNEVGKRKQKSIGH